MTALVVCLWRSKLSVHPQFGRVYVSSLDLLGASRRAAEWVDHRSPVQTKLIGYAQAHQGPMLTVGTNTLYCAAQNPITRATWLALYVPPSTNGFWELARCGRTNLMEVTAEDLNTTFVGLGDRSGSVAFGDDWASSAVRVREGEIVFARRVGEARPVYVIHFRIVSGMKYEIQYAVVRGGKPANQGAPANRRPAGQADGSDNLSATLAAGRAFPVAVGDPWR